MIFVFGMRSFHSPDTNVEDFWVVGEVGVWFLKVGLLEPVGKPGGVDADVADFLGEGWLVLFWVLGFFGKKFADGGGVFSADKEFGFT